mmetsp:Transcript_103026/g.322375  ORF Transcript_103026/g.322375 Transcript_103026/m.322375 type:complete len:389 (+) Transcript_103026:139-1305(+)
MEPQVIGKADEELEELRNLATPELPWPHELPAAELPGALVRAVFGSLAAEAEAELQRVSKLPPQALASDTVAKQNRREAYLNPQRRRHWESRARLFLERRPDVVRALSTEALYSALMMQHLLELDAADPDLPAAERCSEDAFEDGINSQFLLDATRGRFVVEGEVFHFAEAEADESEEALLERTVGAVRQVVLQHGGSRLLEWVTTAMSQSGIAAVERAGLCRAAVSGGCAQVDYRLDEDPERKDGLLVRLQTRRQGFREYLLDAPGASEEDAAPLSCASSSSLQKTATVSYGPGGEVDVLDFREDVHIRRGGEMLEPELLCTAVPWVPAKSSAVGPEGTAPGRWSLTGCVRKLCSRCRPRRGMRQEAQETAAGGGAYRSGGAATLEL